MQPDAFHEVLKDSRVLNLHGGTIDMQGRPQIGRSDCAAIDNESCAAAQLSPIVEELQSIHHFPILVDCPA